MRYRIILIFVYSFTFSSVSINDLSYGAQIDTNFQILFVSERDGNPEIYTICSDSSQERRVTDNGKVNLYPIWHTQQSAIIFIHDPGDGTLIAELDLDSTNDLEFLNPDPFLVDGPLVLSSSGRWLTYYSRREIWEPYLLDLDTQNEYSTFANGDLVTATTWLSNHDTFVFSISRGGLFRIEDIGEQEIEPLATDIQANKMSSSPEGDAVVFSSIEGGTSTLFILDVDTRNIQELRNLPDNATAPIWSPDGEWILYEVDEGRTSSLHMVRPDSSDNTEVISGLELYEYPIWLSDSRGFLFVSSHEGNSEIYKLNLEEGSLNQLTNNSSPDYMISVARDHVCEN